MVFCTYPPIVNVRGRAPSEEQSCIDSWKLCICTIKGQPLRLRTKSNNAQNRQENVQAVRQHRDERWKLPRKLKVNARIGINSNRRKEVASMSLCVPPSRQDIFGPLTCYRVRALQASVLRYEAVGMAFSQFSAGAQRGQTEGSSLQGSGNTPSQRSTLSKREPQRGARVAGQRRAPRVSRRQAFVGNNSIESSHEHVVAACVQTETRTPSRT